MELVKAEWGTISNEEIRDRFLRTRPAQCTECYVAIEKGAEVGFLAVDPIPENPEFIIYTLFVPNALRRQGFGTRLLEAAEQLGRDYGYHTALLSPRPLDSAIPKRQLMTWYRKRGYDLAPEPNQAEDFTKNLKR
jgi:GNAT superfamily N-acetyltransferase